MANEDVGKALLVLTSPIRNMADYVFVKPVVMTASFSIDFASRYFLDSSIGHSVFRCAVNPSLVWILDRMYNNRKLYRLFGKMNDWNKTIVLGMASFMDQDLLNKPLTQIIANVSEIYCGVMYGPNAREDAHLFFNLCQKVNGRIVGVNFGNGIVSDTNNAFFPAALQHGVHKLGKREELLAHTVELETTSKARFKGLVCSALSRSAEMASFEPNGMHAQKERKTDSRRASCSSQDEQNTGSTTQHNIIQTKLLHTTSSVDVTLQEEYLNASPKRGSISSASTEEGQPLVRSAEPWPTLYTKVRAASKKIGPKRLKIAMSCLLCSCLTYRTDEQLAYCQQQDFGLLPGVEILSVETGSSGTSMIAFVDQKHKWAVCSYRGTQFEVVRQMLTSLDFTLEHFETGNVECDAKIRKLYTKEVLKSSEINFDQDFQGIRLSPMQLIRRLNNQGYKIYLTGHSLGGGLATVLAARLLSFNIPFEALITFGATPVGDQEFVNWFNKKVDCSWRFVFGDEFAPMTPPIPFTSPSKDQKLVHVGELIHFRNEVKITPINAEEVEKMIGTFANQTGLVKVFADHNPMNTMRELRNFRFGPEQLMLRVKGDPVDGLE